MLFVREDGFASAVYDLPPVEPGARFDVGTIELSPESALEGRVVDEEGRPWEADLELGGTNEDRGRFGVEPPRDEPTSPRRTRSDPAGRFLFGGLAAGAYSVRVRVGGRPPQTRLDVRIARGELSQVEVAVPRGLAVAGRVLSPEQEPLPGVFVQVFPPEATGELVGSASTGSDGRFRIEGLASGDFVLSTTIGMVTSRADRERLATGWFRAQAGDDALGTSRSRAARGPHAR